MLALVLLLAPPPYAAKLVTPAPGGPAVIEVTGPDKAALAAIAAAKPTAADWARRCKVQVDGTDAELADRPAVTGTWSVTAAAVRFEPLFPLAPGLRYRVTCDFTFPGVRPGDTLVTSVLVPKPPPGPEVAVTAVYPSAAVLPENTLRVYVHFSGPVARGDVYRHVKLVRDDGKEVSHPFLELDEELWSTDDHRLTLLFHPGRVKRGLVPREQEGPILEEGRRYTLVIDRAWKDADGRPLRAEFRKTFRAGPPDDHPVDPAEWAVMAPRGGDSPVIVRLAKPLDRALLGRLVWVADAAGNRVEGTLTVGGGERVLTFAPAKPWAKGAYKLVIDTRLEDVCGNRVGEPFEIDVFKPVQGKIETKTVERPFAVR